MNEVTQEQFRTYQEEVNSKLSKIAESMALQQHTLEAMVINQDRNRNILEGDPSSANEDGIKGKLTRVTEKVKRHDWIFAGFATASLGGLATYLANLFGSK